MVAKKKRSRPASSHSKASKVEVARSNGSNSEKAESPRTEKSALQLYLHEIGQIPLLKPEAEVELARRIRKGDEEARTKMIRSNLRLVVKIAHDYSNFGLPLPDLISEGNFGLIKAIERFDPDKGGRLSTYASWWIKQSIKRALANQSKTIRLPVHLVDRIARIRKVGLHLSEELGREPTDEEIAYEMGVPASKISHLKSVSTRPTSLDAPMGGQEGPELGDMVGDENAANPFENLRNKSLMNDISRMVERLDEREAEIIRMRFGLGGQTPKTLEQVGKAFDITRERVRQLQNMALSKMRRNLINEERQRSIDEVHEEKIQQQRMQVLQEFLESRVNSN